MQLIIIEWEMIFDGQKIKMLFWLNLNIMINDDFQIIGEGIVLYIMLGIGIVVNGFVILVLVRFLKMQLFSLNVFVFGLFCVYFILFVFFLLFLWLFYIKGEWIGGKRFCDF